MKTTFLKATVFGLGLAVLPLPVLGQEPASVPVPAVKPLGFAPARATPPSFETTGAIPRGERLAAVNPQLKAGLDALSNRNGAEAIAIRNRMPDSLDRQMLTWSISMSGLGDVPATEIAGAQRQLQGWPGLKSFRANSEKALFRENPAPAAVLAAFGDTAPETTEGTMLLARAHLASGDKARATSLIRDLWRGDALDVETEDRVISEFSGLLTTADHRARMDYLLYRERASQAKRFATLGEAQSLYKAWAGLISRAKNVDALIAAVDKSWAKDPALLFIRLETLRRAQDFEEAAKLIAQMPRDAKVLINGGAWWDEQRIVARGLADLGKYREAYKIVSRHVATEATDFADAEFHAGWYALRALNDPKTASRHFARILEVSNRPLSASRAWYWLGRAAEALKDGKAGEHFARAAQHSSTFYGQLAAARIDRPGIQIPYPQPSDEDRQRFQGREAIQAIARYEAAGHGWRAQSLYRALADQLDSPGELALLSARAEKSEGGHQLSLQIGKTAYARGIDVPALAFPVGVIPPSANIAGSGKALAYAIARQESAFNPAAVSPANARGLLQLLPSTAKGVAARHGIAYQPDKLTRDPGFNATLGAHYLGEQIDAFGGSYILTFIAYNAGPRKVPEWIERYGDPRGKSIDEVVDWIERIPFPETRNYVMRVMENYQVYKSRLGQKTDIVHDLRFGR
ncbi:lytic transglycosylase domain-containing protein [Rhizobium sp. 'Codium 1']|uniref:lytic transglycosylase domain-containing protein n=1 Tax=Rhizobium sp. 'Codium 1' TaxID=2940484 RepID=UPI001E407187|nr:lytic transglycosylase domain-containing protein [Rhizobium sp. 'Codium 1']MCC8933656.1 lytic transglycosylase domain-containing protein [Rhizobium sp. 'Codium 1']